MLCTNLLVAVIADVVPRIEWVIRTNDEPRSRLLSGCRELLWRTSVVWLVSVYANHKDAIGVLNLVAHPIMERMPDEL